ncbi:MAG: hypothetical protein WCC04_10035 [Terriglobales bacterium]
MKYAILFLALFAMPLQGQKPSLAPSPDQGRYQLLPVTLGERGNVSQQLFLFDSQTGRVWHYRPENLATGSGKPEVELEAFLPVMIQSAGKMQVTPDGN